MSEPKMPNLESNFSSIDLSETVTALEDFKKRFGLGGALASFVVHMANNPVDIDDETTSDGGAMDEHSANEVMSFVTLSENVGPTLEKVGLTLEQVDAGGAIYTAEGQGGTSEVRLNIIDGDKFLAYLNSLIESGANESQKTALMEVSKMLSKQLESQYDLSSGEDDRLIQFVSNIRKLSDAYTAIGAEFGAEEYVEPVSGKYLREYLKAKELMLHSQFANDGFVLRWHINCIAETLEHKWEEVLSILKYIYENKNATELYAVASKTAKNAISQAIKDVESWDETQDDHYGKNKERFLSILKSVQSRLSEF